MKRLSVILAAIAVLAAGCSKDDNPVSPSDDNHVQFKATLLPANEAPTPIVSPDPEASASGTATIDFTLTRDSAGAITAATANFRVDMTGFPASTAITAAHIHTGASGVAGAILVSADVSANQVTLTNGAGTFSRLNIAISPVSNAQAIINNPAGFYFNVHTLAHGGGVMRGQLVKQ
jgi:hypothetical protein